MACIPAGQGERTVDSVLLAISAHHWHNVSGADWVAVDGLWVAVAGLIVAIIGLIAAISGPLRRWRQERAERRARELARREEEFHVAELKGIAARLGAAIRADDLQAIQYHLEEWRTLAAKVNGLLMDAKSDAVSCMKKSIDVAREASNASTNPQYARSAYRDAQYAITAARDTLITWVSRQ